MIKKLGLVLHCLVSPPSGSWSTSLEVCGSAQAKRTWRAPSAHKDTKGPSRCVLSKHQQRQGLPYHKLSSGSSGSRGITRHRRLVLKKNQREYKCTQSLPLYCLVSPTSGSWSTSLDVCGSAQKHKRRSN